MLTRRIYRKRKVIETCWLHREELCPSLDPVTEREREREREKERIIFLSSLFEANAGARLYMLSFILPVCSVQCPGSSRTRVSKRDEGAHETLIPLAAQRRRRRRQRRRRQRRDEGDAGAISTRKNTGKSTRKREENACRFSSLSWQLTFFLSLCAGIKKSRIFTHSKLQSYFAKYCTARYLEARRIKYSQRIPSWR